MQRPRYPWGRLRVRAPSHSWDGGCPSRGAQRPRLSRGHGGPGPEASQIREPVGKMLEGPAPGSGAARRPPEFRAQGPTRRRRRRPRGSREPRRLGQRQPNSPRGFWPSRPAPARDDRTTTRGEPRSVRPIRSGSGGCSSGSDRGDGSEARCRRPCRPRGPRQPARTRARGPATVRVCVPVSATIASPVDPSTARDICPLCRPPGARSLLRRSAVSLACVLDHGCTSSLALSAACPLPGLIAPWLLQVPHCLLLSRASPFLRRVP